MNKYRNFKYPFGGETPDEFAAARQQYYANESDRAYQNLDNTGTVVDPSTLIKSVNERNRSEIQRRVQSMNSRPKDGGTIIKNHDRLYDYYKVGDRLYYRKKGGKNWINISDNEIAQKRINATIAKNKKSYGGNKNATKSTLDNSSDLRAQGFVQNDKGYWVRPEDLRESTTYDAGTLNDVVVTGTRRNTSSAPKRVQGSTDYKSDRINDIVKNAIYSKRPEFVPSKVKPSSTSVKNVKPQGRRLIEPKTRPYRYIDGRKYNIYTDGKGNWIE